MNTLPSTLINMQTRHLEAKAQARFTSRNGQTVMSDRFAKAPLKWSPTFADGTQGGISVYLQDVSPGWMDGDEYDIHLHLESGSQVSIRTTTYGKIHPSSLEGPGTRLNQTIELSDARLSYCPEPVIPFRGARFTSRTTIRLTGSSQLFWSECWAPGRVHKGERFEYHSIDSLTEIEWDGRLLVWDPFRYEPGKQSANRLGAWEQFTHCATIWFIDAKSTTAQREMVLDHLHALTEQQKGTLRMAASLLDGPGVSIRMLADNAADIQQLTMSIWQWIRQSIWLEQQPVWTAPGEALSAGS